jgi:hypothetical protein
MWHRGRGTEYPVSQRGEPAGVDFSLVGVERLHVGGHGTVHRGGLGCRVVGMGGGQHVGQIDGLPHGQAEAAPEGRVRRAHGVPDGVQPDRDRPPVDDQPAQPFVQPGPSAGDSRSRSTTVTSCPARASSRAANSPAAPPPTMTTRIRAPPSTADR